MTCDPYVTGYWAQYEGVPLATLLADPRFAAALASADAQQRFYDGWKASVALTDLRAADRLVAKLAEVAGHPLPWAAPAEAAAEAAP